MPINDKGSLFQYSREPVADAIMQFAAIFMIVSLIQVSLFILYIYIFSHTTKLIKFTK